ncbi:hypothetical protein D9758_009843 [Tetrapyrgos nigripes]|uniref:DUF6534 domain-containing protein n=1 Tax=Tetrapyrgos nigripes TaxID=182062 RepID=A0A8H5GN37_9AGAR|nr:hypothetical protein D9758_009843 [Tetrapyrgos nigripes]
MPSLNTTGSPQAQMPPGAVPFTDPSLLPRFDNTLGAVLLGGLGAMALWGVLCAQTYNFFVGNSKDKPVFKLLIAFLWALDTFDSVLNCHILYHYLVSNYLNPFAVMVPVCCRSIIIHVAITSLSNFIIRSMFARRIYRLSGSNIPMTLWIVAVSFADLICGIVITVKAFGISSYLELDKLSSLMYLNFASGTTSDLSVALVLCFLLGKSRTGFIRTDSLISVLMLYAVNTGLIVALDAFLGLITYIVMPHNFIFLGFYLLLSKLYLNSYLATLNARESLRERVNEPRSVHLSDLSYPRFGMGDSEISGPTYIGGEKSPRSNEFVAISVETISGRERVKDTDGDSSPHEAHSAGGLGVAF